MQSTVQLETEACLTAEFGMGSGDPSPYGRPIVRNINRFKKVANFTLKDHKTFVNYTFLHFIYRLKAFQEHQQNVGLDQGPPS